MIISSQQFRIILDQFCKFQNQNVHSSYSTCEHEFSTKFSTVFLNLNSDLFFLSTANDTEFIALHFECVFASKSQQISVLLL